jgi:thioredoxin reductase
MGLANQVGNQVTLSYRKEQFSRIKERNAKRIEESVHRGKVTVVFNSLPIEIRPESVLLEVAGQVREIANDYVFIFAGGALPYDFLKKIGVQFGMHDMTLEGSHEAHRAQAANAQLAQAST